MNHRLKQSILLPVLVCLCSLALVLLYAPPAQAQCSPTVTVTSNAATGAGTLRQALVDVCDGGTIDFAADMTITLTAGTGQLTISKNMTIDGTGHNVIVSGGNATRVFLVSGAYTVVLRELDVVNGLVSGTGSGGGLRNSGGTVIVEDCVFSGHRAYTGGGLGNLTGSLTVRDTTIAGNTAAAGAGVFNVASLTMIGSTVFGNIADDPGSDDGTGGGLQNATGATSSVTNSTFTGNRADGPTDDGGGGIMVYGGTVNLTNCTIASNSTTANGTAAGAGGGGIRNTSGTVNIVNTLVANNASSNLGPDIRGSVDSGDYNLIESTAGASILGFTSYCVFNADPLLSVLGSYGGNTQTMGLAPGSPAIDAADGATCAASPVSGVDQRGVARTTGASCDIGAFESRGFGVIITGGNNQTTLINTAFTDPLAVRVSSAFGEPIGPVWQLTFAGPASGASTNPASSTQTVINSTGVAEQAVTANGTTGSYTVTVSARGVITAYFHLTNERSNVPPAAPGGSGITDEDQDYTFPYAILSYTDADSDPFVHLRVVTLPADGTLYLDADGDGQIDAGEALQVDDLVLMADFAASRWKFKPDADENGNPYAEFTCRVYDGLAESTADTTLEIVVSPVNDPPTIAPIADRQIGVDSVLGPLNVILGDVDTPATSLTLSGESSNLALVSDVGLSGTGLTRTLIITPTASASGVTTITLTVEDDEYDASTSFVLTVSEGAGQTRVYLPLAVHNAIYAPDLVVLGVGGSGSDAGVLIANIGSAPVVNEFWVDLYVAPDVAPTAVNQTWQLVGSHGAAWGITGGALPLEPGQAIYLNLSSPYLVQAKTDIDEIVTGTILYAQVDSAAAGSAYGAVLESHEILGGTYNNIMSSVENPTIFKGQIVEPVRARPDLTAVLPERP